jgi:hypothetical protein
MSFSRRKFLEFLSVSSSLLVLSSCSDSERELSPLEFIKNLDFKRLSGVLILHDLKTGGKFKKVKALRSFSLLRSNKNIPNQKKELNNQINKLIENDFLNDKVLLIKGYEFSKIEIRLYHYIVEHSPSILN